MQHQEKITEAGHLVERGQSCLNLRTRQFELLGEKWPRGDGLGELGNEAGHAVVTDEGGLRLLQRRQVFREIGEFLKRQTGLQPSGMSEIVLPHCSWISAVAMATSLPSAPISCTPASVACLRMPWYSSPAFVSTMTVP